MKEIRWILWPTLLLGLIASGIYMINYTPQACAYKYVYAYHKKDFHKMLSYYDQESIINKFSQDEIIEVLSQQVLEKGKIKRKDVTVIQDQKTKKWFVEFPFSLENIYVFAPTGANVYLDNQKITDSLLGQGIEIKDILPGKHQVKIEYYNNMYPAFTKEINVPQENKVESPYNTHDIEVFVPAGTWTRMAGRIKHNSHGKVIFENMLPGQYDLSLFTHDQEIEVFSQKIQIDHEHTKVHMEAIKGSETLTKDLADFFTEFNIAYKNGIINKDVTFLHEYATKTINEDIISDFKMWYIDHKDIKNAKSLMQVRDVYPLSGNQLKASVLEIVYLTDIDKEYRVVIEWNYQLLRNNSTWQIIQRDIQQSIVAYKDEKGNWIKY